MNLIPGLNWLATATWRRAEAHDEGTPDPADMGTAFGLDAAMASDTPPPASPASSPAPLGDRLVRRPRR